MEANKPNVAVLTPRSRMNEAQKEVENSSISLSRVVQTLMRIGEQFNQALVDSTNETALYKNRVAELERRNNENRSTVNGAAVQKLKRMKRVLRDLIEDLPEDDELSARNSPRRPADGVRGDELKNASPVVSSSDVSLHFATPPLQPLGTTLSPVARPKPKLPQSPPKTSSAGVSPQDGTRLSSLLKPSILSADENRRMATNRVPQTVTKVNPSPRQSPPKLPSPRVSPQNRSPMSTFLKRSALSPDENWQMTTNRAPQSAKVVCPMPWKGLQQQLGLPEDMVYSLESLSQMDDLCFRVQIVDDMAFIYEPFTMDCPSASLLLDWGTQSDNLLTAQYITNNLATHPYFHTFILSAKKDIWYYIGAHTWTLTRLFSVWSVMDDQTKRKIVSRLLARCRRRHTTQDIRQMLDDGRLAQFCVEVSSTALTSLSEAFARRLDYQKPT
ncbi:hypothetical protein EDC04DRAFT_3136097 [Pisolithus marmoratus]|nr:hypothetical protein EDC04DRAFT_3136097 [Pisolithus marmoratus]